MNQSTKRILFTMLAMLILLAACAPKAAPTQDPALIQNQINQAVEATLAVQNAQATQQQAVIVPSNTSLPTQTEAVPASPTALLPTATPFVIIPPTNTVVVTSGGASDPVVKPQYACDAINRKPYDNTVFHPNGSFHIKGTIVNIGTKTMRKGLDLKYFSGPNMTTLGLTRIELPELKPGDKYQVIMDGTAPAKLGFYVMTWIVEGQLCYPYVALNVEK